MERLDYLDPVDFDGVIKDGTRNFGEFRCVESAVVTPDKKPKSYIIYREFAPGSTRGNRTVAEILKFKRPVKTVSDMQCEKIKAGEAALLTNSARMYKLLAKIRNMFKEYGLAPSFELFTANDNDSFSVDEIDELFEKISDDTERLLDGEII